VAEQPIPLAQQIREAVALGPRRHAYPEIPTPSAVVVATAPHPEELDPRLEGYQLMFLLSGPPPGDDHAPLTEMIIPMHGHFDHGWLLWHVWLWWPGSSVVGELRRDPHYGWIAGPIIRPSSRQDDVKRIVRALAILQRRVPPMGRPRVIPPQPRLGKYDDLDSFLADARRQRDLYRRRAQPFTQQRLAQDLGMSRRNFQRGLTRCRLTWIAFCQEPPCAKKSE
jgi:hypothetical protein